MSVTWLSCSIQVPRRVEVGGTLCNLCELVVKFVDTYVTSNKTEVSLVM